MEGALPIGLSLYCWGVVVVFAYTTLANIIERTDGIIIASFFILFILIVSGISRYWRAKEIRVGGHRFAMPSRSGLWNQLVNKKVNMVPSGSLDKQSRISRAAQAAQVLHRRRVLWCLFT